jgi:hypothetical protein
LCITHASRHSPEIDSKINDLIALIDKLFVSFLSFQHNDEFHSRSDPSESTFDLGMWA